MNKTKRTRLEARGWRVGSAKDFLGLSPEEAALVETRLALSQALRSRRVAHGLTQGELARRLKSSQSRVAKMEAGDKTVSVDLLVKALFSLGAKPRDVGRALQCRVTAAA
ncbi:MAG: helix-turn-helix domain-containing protein [Acidobacteriota bacterium]|jgi:ribosome-binding protein aMBF1 (putative translation factor)|nr:helix-turn-helix transcriptional regulator [Acidobacteriota bacterium]MDQ3419447.1 helix-turn-helix domain-containing protein [Acidobacteriota bacterium]